MAGWERKNAFPQKGKREMILTSMIRFAAAALFLTAAYAGQPTGGTTTPTPVREVEKPAFSAVSAYCDVILVSQNSGICTAMTVPAGKILVIDHTSAVCSFNEAAPVSVLALNFRTAIAANPNVDVEIPMVKQAVGNGFAYWKGSLSTRSYANPGTLVQAFGLRTSGTVTYGYCAVTLIGHYVQAQ